MQPDDRSPIAHAAAWSSRIVSVAIEMVVPGLMGYGLDRLLGTLPLFVIIGFALGCVLATLHLIRMTKTLSQEGSPQASEPDTSEPK